MAHYLNGGIRFQTPMQKVTPQVKAHLSVLMAVLAMLKAVDYYLEKYELVYSTRGVVQGAGYTDAVHVGGGVVAWVSQIDPSQPSY